MTTIMNAQADNPDIEFLSAVSASHECDIIYSDLSAADKLIYDDAMTVIVQDCICKIENTPYTLEMNRMTSNPINVIVDDITETTLDYLTLSAADQAKLDALNQLTIDNCW